MYLSKSTELFWASRVAQTVKYLPAMQETWVWSPEVENGNPLQYSCLEGYSPWGRKRATTTRELYSTKNNHNECTFLEII